MISRHAQRLRFQPEAYIARLKKRIPLHKLANMPVKGRWA